MRKILFIMLVIMLLAAALGALGEFPSWAESLGQTNTGGGSGVIDPEPPKLVCESCGSALVGTDCLNVECSNYLYRKVCSACGEWYDSKVYDKCQNANCPSNLACKMCGALLSGSDCLNPDCENYCYRTVCPTCGEWYDSSKFTECQNADCPGKVVPDPVCTACGIKLSNSKCLNSACENYYYRKVCSACGKWYDSSKYSECQNADCPSKVKPDPVCTECGTVLSGTDCLNSDCVNYLYRKVCAVCSQWYDSSKYNECQNSSCLYYGECSYCSVKKVDGECRNSSCPYYGECPNCASGKVDGECPFCDYCDICESWYDNVYANCPNCYPEPDPVETCPYCSEELIEGSCCNSSCPYYGECPDCATGRVNGECPNPDCPGKIEICEECGWEIDLDGCKNSGCINYYYRRDCDCGEWWDESTCSWCQNPECPYVCSICGSDRTDGVCTNPDCSSYIPDEPEIVFSTTLSEDGIITITIQKGDYAESGYRLYDEAGNIVLSVETETALTWDVSSYLTAGQKYYVDGRLWTEGDMKEITVRSEIITYSGPGTLCETCKIGYVKGSGNCTYSYCSTHYDHCTVTLGVDKVAFVSPESASEYEFTLYRYDGQEYAKVVSYPAWGSSCDFSSDITEGIYYVTCTLYVYDGEGEIYEVITLVSENVTFESGRMLCSVCNEGYKDVATGLCSNENCSSHNSDVTYKVTFSSAGIAECEGASDATWTLYDADTKETVHTVYSTGASVDFSSYMEDGKSYYVSVHDITDDDTFGTYYSDTVTFSDGGSTKLTCRVCNVGYIAEGGTCSNTNCITNNPDSYYVTLGTTGAASCAKVTDATWTLYNADTDEVVDTINTASTPVDFSSYMEDGKSYYVIVSFISGDNTNGTYRSNTVTFSNDEDDGFTKLICTACNVGYITEGGTCSNVNCSVNNSDTYTVILGATGAAACAKVSDATWTLYDADTNAEVCTISATASPVDFSSYMEDGRSYYVIVSSISGDDTDGTYRSGTITFSNNDDSGSVKLTCDACNVGYIAEGGTCSNADCITNNPDSYYVTFGNTGAVACARVSDATWTLYDADTGEEVHTISATGSPVDFSSHMESGKSYYVIVEGISGDSTHGTYRSNTITFSDDDDNDDDLSEARCMYCGKGVIDEGDGFCNNPDCENYG